MDTRAIEAGEMFGFKVVNIFPANCTDDEWTEFADTMSRILKKSEEAEKALA